MLDTQFCDVATLQVGSDVFPTEVQIILSALESGQFPSGERRLRNRARYRVQATLRLFSDAPEARPRVLYTRDVCTRGIGFITAENLPLGHGGRLELAVPGGRRVQMQCTLSRCRIISMGWYEGALHFVREQLDFANLDAATQCT